MTTWKKLLQWFKRIWAVVSGERPIARNHDIARKTHVASGLPEDRDGGSRTPTTSRPTVFETARCLTCGHRWNAAANHIQQGRGCPACLRVSQEEWNRRAAAEHIAFEEPVVTANDHAPVRCVVCGYRWSVTPKKIFEGRGCPRCSGRIVNQAEWDDRARAVGIAWERPMRNSHRRSPAQCLTCGHRRSPWPSNVSRGQGCPACHGPGFDSSAPSRLYLLVIPGPGLIKIGVTAQHRVRLERHRGRGWQVVKTWALDDGQSALDLEMAVLGWWHESGATQCERDEVPAGDGFTECVHVGRVDVPGTLAFIEGLSTESEAPRPRSG